MSAYVVNKATIDLVISVWRALKLDAGEAVNVGTCTALGRNLWRENELSVEVLYGERHPDMRRDKATRDALGSYTFEAIDLDLAISLPRCLGAIRCLVYQSCERSSWERSRACRMLTELRAKCEARVPMIDDPYHYGKRIPLSWGWSVDPGTIKAELACMYESDYRKVG